MSTTRRRLPREQRKAEILEAALKVFAEKGYRKASITDINRKAKIARGTFYQYFESKREIFLELVESYFAGYAAILHENQRRLERAFKEGSDPLVAWRVNVASIFRFHSENPLLTELIYRQAIGRDEDFAARITELSNLARGQLIRSFRLMEKRGMQRPGDLDVVTSINMGATVNMIMVQVLLENRTDFDVLADELVDNQVRALAPPGINVERAIEVSKRRRDEKSGK
jgi:AcrR family transcriptional regulator